jgi:enoyl-CoA hydratase/carnithine racemase
VGFEGANPGGGGIELLCRLAGRSRALEVVLGADRIDADTAALYGGMFPLVSFGLALLSSL